MFQQKVISAVREEKPQIVMDYNHHMGYGDKGGRMVDNPSAIRHSSGQKFVHPSVRPDHSQ
jgi:phage I-like protein